MKLAWLPWKYIVKRVARAEGLIDPIQVLSQLHKFAQPAEVDVPMELIRSGAVMQATGLINSRALQHNTDWIWPYWIERQFDPNDEAFVARGISHAVVNLTHRNWTAVGIPGNEEMPVVDPRGLVMPFYNSWSVDCWLVTERGEPVIPSKNRDASQRLDMDGNITVVTRSREGHSVLVTEVATEYRDGIPVCVIRATGESPDNGHIVVAIRPCNPEGVSFIETLETDGENSGIIVNDKYAVHFPEKPERVLYSQYHEGDVYYRLNKPHDGETGVTCDVGLASGAAMFPIEGGKKTTVAAEIPLHPLKDKPKPSQTFSSARDAWEHWLDSRVRVALPDRHMQFLYDAALRSMVVHAPDEVYAGPYRYKRFWFRDAAFILHAMLCAGIRRPVERVLASFPDRQKATGYFESQHGEWDSNGQVLWILERYLELTGTQQKPEWKKMIGRGAEWILRKRTDSGEKSPHSGLLPAGYSAEHLGPSDYYYWDDFWSVAGLLAASSFMRRHGEDERAEKYSSAAKDLMDAIETSLAGTADRLGRPAMPASPYRRLDSGAVGSLAAGYPLFLWPKDDVRLIDTASYLLDKCMHRNGFFHDIMHSGINPYLTLHIAQVLMRSGDMRYLDLVGEIADIASDTGQWPEAVHPRTNGGCMGDGQHIWAASEWVMMMRNCFVYEDIVADRLVLCSGIPFSWLAGDEPLSFGPAPTRYGTVTVTLQRKGNAVFVEYRGDWYGEEPEVVISFPESHDRHPDPGTLSLEIAYGGSGA